jgi:hypothetical protein
MTAKMQDWDRTCTIASFRLEVPFGFGSRFVRQQHRINVPLTEPVSRPAPLPLAHHAPLGTSPPRRAISRRQPAIALPPSTAGHPLPSLPPAASQHTSGSGHPSPAQAVAASPARSVVGAARTRLAAAGARCRAPTRAARTSLAERARLPLGASSLSLGSARAGQTTEGGEVMHGSGGATGRPVQDVRRSASKAGDGWRPDAHGQRRGGGGQRAAVTARRVRPRRAGSWRGGARDGVDGFFHDRDEMPMGAASLAALVRCGSRSGPGVASYAGYVNSSGVFGDHTR